MNTVFTLIIILIAIVLLIYIYFQIPDMICNLESMSRSIIPSRYKNYKYQIKKTNGVPKCLLCDNQTPTIYINTNYDKESVNRAFIHELAHAITRCDHTDEFYNIEEQLLENSIKKGYCSRSGSISNNYPTSN